MKKSQFRRIWISAMKAAFDKMYVPDDLKAKYDFIFNEKTGKAEVKLKKNKKMSDGMNDSSKPYKTYEDLEKENELLKTEIDSLKFQINKLESQNTKFYNKLYPKIGSGYQRSSGFLHSSDDGCSM